MANQLNLIKRFMAYVKQKIQKQSLNILVLAHFYNQLEGDKE